MRTLLISILLATSIFAGEREIVKKHCKGQIEVVMPDRTRCDCLTSTHAIEYDWASKQFQGTGQALHYAMYTGKKAGLVLILKKESDIKHVKRAMKRIEFYKLPVTVWVIKE